jgi:molybdopterin-biosynthesis enzyme MoeA-like protein
MTTAFGIIIIGDEILSGKRADKHLPKTIELLAERGLQLAYADYVGDDPARITATLARAFAAARSSGDVVFSCGGIGATPDDHTRGCAAHALGVDLILHPQAKDLITERMRDVALEQGEVFDADRDDNIHRLNMGVFPAGANIIPNPYNKIPGFSCAAGEAGKSGSGGVHFLPGFPVMAWPMMAWVLDTLYPHLHQKLCYQEKSIIVLGSMEATLTPLMIALEAQFTGVKVFSLPSVDHPVYGRHIELGVKGSHEAVAQAYPALLAGLAQFKLKTGPELVR